MSNYWSDAFTVIDTKWWINWPDDSHCLNQSVSQYATLGRQRDIHLLMTVDLFTDQWPLDPLGKCVDSLWSQGQRSTAACKWDSEETVKIPEVFLQGFMSEFGYPPMPKRYQLILSEPFSLNVLLCDCYRFNKGNQHGRVAFTRSNLISDLPERGEVKILSEQGETHHPLW